MKKLFSLLVFSVLTLSSYATIHTIQVWDGYYQFIPTEITFQLGDTVQWLPLDQPSMVHTVTSKSFPAGAQTFDYTWQAPADTFFQYTPQFIGIYDYVCTPHEDSWNMVGTFTVTDSTTSISENEELFSLIFPNPVKEEFSVSEEVLDKTFNIFTLNGQVVFTGNLQVTNNIAVLPKGNYIIEIVGDKPRYLKLNKK